MEDSLDDQTDNFQSNPIVFLDIAVESEKGNNLMYLVLFSLMSTSQRLH